MEQIGRSSWDSNQPVGVQQLLRHVIHVGRPLLSAQLKVPFWPRARVFGTLTWKKECRKCWFHYWYDFLILCGTVNYQKSCFLGLNWGKQRIYFPTWVRSFTIKEWWIPEVQRFSTSTNSKCKSSFGIWVKWWFFSAAFSSITKYFSQLIQVFISGLWSYVYILLLIKTKYTLLESSIRNIRSLEKMENKKLIHCSST